MIRGAQPDTGLKLSHDRKVSPRGIYQASRDRWVPTIPNGFGLTAGASCPGKTSFCESCYASRSERSAGVSELVGHNLAMLQAAGGPLFMEALLAEMLDRYRAEADRVGLPADQRVFRIHWDGDFFSLDYATAWAEAMAVNGDISFWAYTRSFTDPVNVVPILDQVPNLALYLSIDAENAPAARAVLAQHPDVLAAYCGDDYNATRALAEPGRRAPVICPENAGRMKLMDNGVGACVTCGLCITGRRDVQFSKSHRDDATAVSLSPRRRAPAEPRACRICATELPAPTRPGRPPVYCARCRPGAKPKAVPPGACQDCGNTHTSVWEALACDTFTDAEQRRRRGRQARGLARFNELAERDLAAVG